MHAYIIPYEFSNHEDDISSSKLVSALCRFGIRNTVDKVIVQRPTIYSTNSVSHKPIAQVNCDNLIASLKVRGIRAVSYSIVPTVERCSSDQIREAERQVASAITASLEDVIILVPLPNSGRRPNVFGKTPASLMPELLKAKGFTHRYIGVTDL